MTTVMSFDYFYSSGAFAKSQRFSWSQGDALNTPVQEIYPSVFNGEIYVAGGFVPSNSPVFFGLAPSNQVYIYAPDKNSWRYGTKLPAARHHLGMASNSQYLYGIGGFYGSKGNAWQAKDNVYKLAANGKAWQSGPSLPIPLAESVYAAHAEHIHVIGGKTFDKLARRNIDTNSHFVLVDNQHWQKAAPATMARNSAACAVLDNKIFVIGGRKAGIKAQNIQFAEMYDTKGDKWEAIKPLPAALAGLTAVALNGKIVVAGGEAFGPNGNWRTGKAFSQIWSYDPVKDSWTQELNMPQPRHGHGAVTLNDKMYIIGGAAKVGPQETLSSLLIMEERA
ncbi:Kelch repeat-containing protein [Thalassomonas actiniarum]|uniref:Kelch-like protein n=1 Tax=Thalassomonas actiniarum TaxID=485447 RepID=A0AAE9YQ40_9GAMM|nr:kelch repeat-containing protein [Thalassomonas actiniarum]WDD97502.1 kelch-like protein [Thalassomonas actiniarum]